MPRVLAATAIPLYQQCTSGTASFLVQHPASVAFFLLLFVFIAGASITEPELQISKREGQGKDLSKHVFV
jgi:hypothetical protein